MDKVDIAYFYLHETIIFVYIITYFYSFMGSWTYMRSDVERKDINDVCVLVAFILPLLSLF